MLLHALGLLVNETVLYSLGLKLKTAHVKWRSCNASSCSRSMSIIMNNCEVHYSVTKIDVHYFSATKIVKIQRFAGRLSGASRQSQACGLHNVPQCPVYGRCIKPQV